MSIERAEKLKSELTDQYVTVQAGIPELRRFQGMTGQVKTVNMNCKALVEFDGPEDIAWYDIDPFFLTVVDGPAEATAEKSKAPAKQPAATKPTAPAKNPLQLAQERAAAAAAPAAAKKLSPLELAKQKAAAANSASDAPPATISPLMQAQQLAGKSEDAKPGKALSPLELAKQKAAAKQTEPAEPPPPELPKGIKADDLKVVEGIGPKIAELLNADGIKTWADLATAPVDRLRKILENAGPRFRMHDPGSWPTQAGLAATGKWDELNKLQDDLSGGKA